jgi:hypothetical protein
LSESATATPVPISGVPENFVDFTSPLAFTHEFTSATEDLVNILSE